MKVKQLSVFLENRTGALSEIAETLQKAGLNIRTLTLADTSEFGILRLILREWEAARDLLVREGHTVKVTEVVAVEVEDRPGGLEAILQVAEQAELGLDYVYAFAVRRRERAVLVFRFQDIDKALDVLQSKGLNVLESVQLFDEDS